jgi:integrase
MPRTRRASGEGSISRNKRGLWVGRIELPPTYGDDGKPIRRRLEKTSTKQRMVLDWIADTRAELASHGAAADATITMAAWSERWLSIRATQVKPATMKIHRSVIHTWVLPTIGSVKLAKLRPADIRAVTDAQRNAGLAAVTMHNTHGLLSTMLSDAVRDGLILDNPAKKIRAPRSGGQTRGAFSVEQVAALITTEAAAGRCRFTTQLLTGMRQAEALGLTWDAIDLDAGMLTVMWQLQSLTREHGCGGTCGRKLGAYCPAGKVVIRDGMPYVHLGTSQYLIPPKGDKVRSVPLVAPLVKALERHRDATADRPNPHGLVFHRPDGVALRPDADQAAWRALLAEVGLPPTATTHWARHTVATLLMQAGVDAKVVAEIVGHSTERITRETYQHTTTALAREGMRRLGELVAG